jgi:hypothetical protein
VISGRRRMMYQSLEPEPEGAICLQRSLPQALHSSPHDTDTSITYWLEMNIQGTAMLTGPDDLGNRLMLCSLDFGPMTSLCLGWRTSIVEFRLAKTPIFLAF